MIAVVAALAAAAIFAPPLDRPLHCRIERTLGSGPNAPTFAIERTLIFHREGDTIVATVTLDRLSTTAPEPQARQFRASAGGLLAHPVRYRLDADGAVAVIEGEDIAWQKVLAGFAALRPARDQSIPDSAAPAATLAAFPAARRRALLTGALDRVVALADAALQPGAQSITLPDPSGGPTLIGRREVARDAAGRISVTTRAASPDEAVTIERQRLVDPATGLLVEERETVHRRLGGLEQIDRSVTRITFG